MSAVFNIHSILEMMPHRYPFLLVDKVEELKENYIVGIKNVTMNEPQFTGHFPENPIMPGVLQLEAMAQVGGLYTANELIKKGIDIKSKLIFFTSINNAKFKNPVIPGDIMRMEIQVERIVERGKMTIMQFHGETKIDAGLASSADLGAWLVDSEQTNREK